MRLGIIAAAALLLSGCGPLPTFKPPAPVSMEPFSKFDEAALQAGMKKGHAIVKGQAFSKTVGGDIKYGAGNEVRLYPDTPYVSECIIITKGGVTSGCFDKIRPYARTVSADGEGRFEFDDVAPGKYVATSLILWGVPGPYGVETTGGIVEGHLTVSSDTDVINVNVD